MRRMINLPPCVVQKRIKLSELTYDENNECNFPIEDGVLYSFNNDIKSNTTQKLTLVCDCAFVVNNGNETIPNTDLYFYSNVETERNGINYVELLYGYDVSKWYYNFYVYKLGSILFIQEAAEM